MIPAEIIARIEQIDRETRRLDHTAWLLEREAESKRDIHADPSRPGVARLQEQGRTAAQRAAALRQDISRLLSLRYTLEGQLPPPEVTHDRSAIHIAAALAA